MMVTIKSHKKVQEPDLLLDQPRLHTNDCNKPSPQRHSRRKSRRHYSSEASNSSITTTLTSTTHCEDDPPSPDPHEGEVVIDNLEDSLSSSEWEESQSPPSRNVRNPQTSPNPRFRNRSHSTSSSSSKWWISSCCPTLTAKQLLVLVLSASLLIALVASTLVILLHKSHSSPVSTSAGSESILTDEHSSSSSGTSLGGEEEGFDPDEYEDSSEQPSNNLDLKEVSRLSWNMLNNNQERLSGKESQGTRVRHHHHQLPPVPVSGGDGLVLPSKMVFTSADGDLNQPTNLSGENDKGKKRSCCRTQKYAQVIRREGCEPLTITNRMCFGQCVSVWVPGLFASFPVCKPSRSSWKTVTLQCGDRRRRVKIEKVRRCSCMEIDPTLPPPTSKR